jgi:hypothetical protein
MTKRRFDTKPFDRISKPFDRIGMFSPPITDHRWKRRYTEGVKSIARIQVRRLTRIVWLSCIFLILGNVMALLALESVGDPVRHERLISEVFPLITVYPCVL